MKFIKKTAIQVIIISMTSLSLAAASIQPTSKEFAIAKLLARELPRDHLSRHYLDDRISKQMFENYLSLLDPERIYFLDSDIKKFKEKETLLDDEIKIGDIQFAFDAFNLIRQRVKDRTEYVNTLLDKGFDLTINEEYRWKRKDAPWAADRDEWNDLWRRRIKNEYIRRIVSKELAEAEKASQTNLNDVAIGPLIRETSSDAIRDFINKPFLIYSSINREIIIAAMISAEKEEQANLLDNKLSPEDFIKKRYDQYLSIIEDSDSKSVLQKYLSAFARAYDPHCDYMSQETSEDFDIDMKLSLVGIGAMLRPDDGTAKVVSLVPGGPADSDTSRNRLRPGDKIIAVAQGDGEFVSILHWPLYKAVRIIRGTKGSKVVLKVIPASDPTGSTVKKVTIIRDEVKLEASAAKSKYRKIKDKDKTYKLGIIDLPAFYADMSSRRNNPDTTSASRDVAKILREMREKNVDGIILDLRNNGGGSLLEAVLMTGLFIKTGPTVQVRERRAVTILPDNNPTIAYSGPMVVLVNRLSASASEIVAAALQDYGRAIIVGDSKTHGKGSVQTILRMSRDPEMGKLKVTNAMFYRISGGSTQLRGVTPDIVVSSAFDFMEFGEDFLPNPMEWTTIRSAIYSPFSDISTVIPGLKQKSQERRKNNESFVAYENLLQRIKKVNKEESLSLNIEVRRSKAKAEQELLDIQNKLMEQGQNKSDDKDIVENEALYILVDLIKTTSKSEAEEAIAEPSDN